MSTRTKSPGRVEASPESLARGSSPSAGYFGSRFGIGVDTRSMVRARIDEGSAPMSVPFNISEVTSQRVGSPSGENNTRIPFSDHSRSAIRDYDPREIRLPDLACVECGRFHEFRGKCPYCKRPTPDIGE